MIIVVWLRVKKHKEHFFAMVHFCELKSQVNVVRCYVYIKVSVSAIVKSCKWLLLNICCYFSRQMQKQIGGVESELFIAYFIDHFQWFVNNRFVLVSKSTHTFREILKILLYY